MSAEISGGSTYALASTAPAAARSPKLYKLIGLSIGGLAAAAGAAAGVGSLTSAFDNSGAYVNRAAPAPPPALAVESAPTPPAPAAAPPRPVQPPPHPGLLEQGDNGPAVTQVQKAVGTTPADGIFGPKTRAAVANFQQNHGLAPDGIVGPRTKAALFAPKPPVAAPVTRHSSSSSSSSYSSTSSGGYAIPASIVMCESGGNYGAVNPSTGAGGAYQIMPSTWRAYGGTGQPQDAPKAEQDAIAAKIYQAQGAAPWSCAK